MNAISVVIPTANRSEMVHKTLKSILGQNIKPSEIIIIDASENDKTEIECAIINAYSPVPVKYYKAQKRGAAIQRNQGCEISKNNFILFCDDDILLEDQCIEKLWTGILSEQNIGGVGAMITNQQYHTPGRVTKFMYRLMSGDNLSSYAGKCIGPAWNLLPEDKNHLPELVPVEWLNTTCTLYRREALPNPPFPDHFKDYSLMEDLTLSLLVGKNWKLLNARTARIFHDSQPGSHKNNAFINSKMELVNRYYVMTKILAKSAFTDHIKFIMFQFFGIVAGLTNLTGWKNLMPSVAGKVAGVMEILKK